VSLIVLASSRPKAQPPLAHAEEPLPPDDEVVEQLDVERFARFS
jgi:hypothetical protein